MADSETASRSTERRSRPREATPIYDQLVADRERRAREQQEAES